MSPDCPLDSYGPLVSAKLAAERVTQKPKLYAFQILEAIRGSRIHDIFEAKDSGDGRNYLVIRFTPGDLSQPHHPAPVEVKAEPVEVKAEPVE